MFRIALAAATIATALISAAPAGADPANDVLCYTNQAFAGAHTEICKTAVNPLGDVPEFPV